MAAGLVLGARGHRGAALPGVSVQAQQPLGGLLARWAPCPRRCRVSASIPPWQLRSLLPAEPCPFPLTAPGSQLGIVGDGCPGPEGALPPCSAAQLPRDARHSHPGCSVTPLAWRNRAVLAKRRGAAPLNSCPQPPLSAVTKLSCPYLPHLSGPGGSVHPLPALTSPCADGEAAQGREPPPPDLNTGYIRLAAGRLAPASLPSRGQAFHYGWGCNFAAISRQAPDSLFKRQREWERDKGTSACGAFSGDGGGPGGRCPLPVSQRCHLSGAAEQEPGGAALHGSFRASIPADGTRWLSPPLSPPHPPPRPPGTGGCHQGGPLPS